MSQDRWAAPRTGKISTLLTELPPALYPRARLQRLTGTLLRRLACECLFAARPQHCGWPTLDAARPPTAKSRRRFPPASARFPAPKTPSASASQKSAMPVIRREFAPASSRSRWPPSDPRHAVRARPQPPPYVDLPLSEPPDALRTPVLAIAADRPPAMAPVLDRRSARSRSRRRSGCPVYLGRQTRFSVQLSCHWESSGA